jgi:SPP1 family predicted phage head-tail adaptor
VVLLQDSIITLIWPLADETEERTGVFATVASVSQKEFFTAQQSGLKPEYKLIVWAHEYEEQPEVEYNGRKYAVYRTFLREDGKTELYVMRKAGV